MNLEKPSSSKNHRTASRGSTSTPPSAVSAGRGSKAIRQSRKRPAAPSSTSNSSSASGSPVQLCNGAWGLPESSEISVCSNFTCSICMDTMNEPTITFCGHTYCRKCIMETIETTPNSRCPKCGTPVAKDKLCPNFVLSDIIARSRNASATELKSEICESTSSLSAGMGAPGNLVRLLSNANFEKLNINDLDGLLMVLQRRRETMATDDEEYKRQLLHEFLSQLLAIKSAHMEQLTREISLINQDISVVELETNNDVNSGHDTVDSASTSKNSMRTGKCFSSSSGIGFNTQPLRNIELEQQSLSARKKRMYHHFDELTDVYLETRNSEVLGNQSNDATVPDRRTEDNDMNGLGRFGKTLAHITQYHGFKLLATLEYCADDILTNSSNPSIVSSIEFDKDNEFFAVAGVTNIIKLYDYINVIGSSVDIHCPTAEISCNAKISCVSWNSFYKNSLASSDYDGCVSLWDSSTCSRVRNLIEHQKRVWSVDWSNGFPHLLASGSDDSKVKLWSTNSEKSVANLDNKSNVCCVKFCPENTYVIAFGSADHCVYYYDFRNLKEPLDVLHGHKKAVSYIQFVSKDELLSASIDSNLKLWNLKDSGNCSRSFTGHINERHFVGLATDGNYIACGSENNSLYLYYKYIPKPLFSFKFENRRSIFSRPNSDIQEFVSAVAWRKGSPVVVAANCRGAIKILELV